MKRQSILHDEKRIKYLHVIQPGKSGRGILKIRTSETTGNVHFPIYFCISKFSRKATKLHEKGHFARIFEKLGAHAPCTPGSYVHGLVIIN